MKKIIFILALLVSILATLSNCTSSIVNLVNKKVDPIHSDSRPISHAIWNELVSQHVLQNGLVDYSNFRADSVRLNQYLTLLNNNHPNPKNWTRAESIAYWINAYNAYTVHQVVQHYPIASIKDIKGGITFVNTIWDEKFINIEGHKYDLNNIEQGILRKYYKEPRIHFALNCASISCPSLANFAYTADQLEEQLDVMAKIFLADKTKNTISTQEVSISKIFKWYKGDFTNGQKLIDYINQYTDVMIAPKAKVRYQDYNWGLNDKDADTQ